MEIHLMEDSITEEETKAVNECFASKRYTQGKLVDDFEKKYAEWNGSKYGVMVNSGSSANLLMVFLLKEKYGLKDGDEVLVPAVTWPTTIYPIIQNNLVPVLCDVDDSLNISIDSIRRMTTEKTKALFVVHLLGQPADMKRILEFCKEQDIVLIEDCCESTGAKYDNKNVGTFGVMSSFSFYFGHHMTTIEGGIILTDDFETYDLLKSARSHGWVRGSNRVDKYKTVYGDTNFLFDMLGYNLRSTNLNAAIGLVQLKKLNGFIETRKNNHRLFIDLISKHSDIKIQKVNLSETSSFSFAIILESKEIRNTLLNELPKRGIECRPVVAGNLLKQPVFDKLKGKYLCDDCKNADIINDRGLFLPNNQFIDKEKVEYMISNIVDLMGSK